MKKITTLLMVLFLLVGCSSGEKSKLENVSDKVYAHAVEVVEIVEEYLEEKVTWEDVTEKILGVEIECVTTEEKAIEKAMLEVWDGMFIYHDDKDSFIEIRNNLAKLLNLEVKTIVVNSK